MTVYCGHRRLPQLLSGAWRHQRRIKIRHRNLAVCRSDPAHPRIDFLARTSTYPHRRCGSVCLVHVVNLFFCVELLAPHPERGLRLALFRERFHGYRRRHSCLHDLAQSLPSNQSMKPTRPLQENLSEFAATPSRGLSCSR